MAAARITFTALQIAALVTAILVPLLSLVLSLGSVLALLVWTYLSVTNVRRVKPATAYETPPKPARAVIWWFMPTAVVVVGGVAFAVADRWVDTTRFDQRGTAELVRALVVIVAVLAFVWFWYKPYGYLARATAWVGGNPSRMKRWFWLPIVTGVLLAVLAAFVTIGVATGDSTTGDVTAADTWPMVAIGFAVPLVSTMVWLICGLRAMHELEAAVHQTAQRKHEQTMDPNVWAAQYVIRPPA